MVSGAQGFSSHEELAQNDAPLSPREETYKRVPPMPPYRGLRRVSALPRLGQVGGPVGARVHRRQAAGGERASARICNGF
jgi:hypothetical protein